MKSRKLRPFPTKADIVIILLVIAAFMFGGIFIRGFLFRDEYITVEMLAAGGEWWWGTPPPYYWLYPSLQKGAVEYDIFRKPTVEILDISYHGQDNRKFAWIKARLRVKKNFRTEKFTYKQTQIEVGRTVSISPNNVSIVGNIIAIEGQEPVWRPETISIEANILSVRDWVVNAIQVGDTMKDNNGNIVAEIMDKRVEPALVVTENWLGDPLSKRDPVHFDVTMVLKIRVQPDGNIKYFNFYQPVQPGQQISVQFNNITMYPNIKRIIE